MSTPSLLSISFNPSSSLNEYYKFENLHKQMNGYGYLKGHTKSEVLNMSV